MTDLATMQSMTREELKWTLLEREDQLAKALEAEKLARAGFDKAAAERDQSRKECAELLVENLALKEQVESLEKQVAAIRDVLSRWEHYMPPTEPYNWSETFSTDFLKKVKAALSTTAGRNYFKVCPKCAYESDK